MWIIRFHLLQPKHYNKISRIYKKYGFSPRSIPAIIFAKASILHHTQKTSWRTIGKQLGADHVNLYRFDVLARKSWMLREIFHIFWEARIALYIGDNKVIDRRDLNNSSIIYDLTKSEFESIFKWL